MLVWGVQILLSFILVLLREMLDFVIHDYSLASEHLNGTLQC